MRMTLTVLVYDFSESISNQVAKYQVLPKSAREKESGGDPI